ncbi:MULTISPECIES: patatin-like phospholipase family protein [unclassified Actinopolyspora]|uniref:patatin-like phospholipase family protein n=1 Tax=unclassified Actinopolyspora TaxID=2639451 RepID=UPI0013F5B6FC|nr:MULTISPECIES: patatin-like phospholipase family protein [unclassified Actinopolyspora]NHD18705.1 patatin-like phospholipase family protein [Actinopolyspora sp. BKK2]NHE77973.1 patatin-like phospholipase family protein [Actinopolyspora sp. BKK1]
MTTAWVLPGGSTFGAVQAGLVSALFDAGHSPDMLVGTSAGALNSAWLAGDPTPHGAEKLREVWANMRRRDVFPVEPTRILAGKIGLSNHVMSNRGLAGWLHRTLPFRRLEEAELPLTVTTTELDSGEAVYFRSGPALPALVASCSIPGVFPPVEVDGRRYVDGGPAAFMPISRAVEQGADRVYVLPCGGTRPLESGAGGFENLPAARRTSDSIPAINGAALSAAMYAASRLDMQLNASRCELYVLPAPKVDRLSPYSFRHSTALIRWARNAAASWLPTAQPVPAEPVDVAGVPLVARESVEAADV